MKDQKNQFTNRRILIVDDNENIHKDFRLVLESDDKKQVDVSEEEEAIFGSIHSSSKHPKFEICSAFQGKEGVEMVLHASKEDRPFAPDSMASKRSGSCGKPTRISRSLSARPIRITHGRTFTINSDTHTNY